ncbi:hypothetical protein [Kibdelosporangium phytohabitans]|uniref:hypothetical protein n=1 Tax=Kibdelosporangium phytohabitans TaxID=860235 RepID=UPI0012F92019|nr:hypothetical protein [Kibdelosporangium phytohabitans]MBE1470288.1 hypothetical protein [Kibdelosporangium phytohabitans]
MSVVVLVLLIALIVAVVGMLGAMVVKDEPFLGAIALGVLLLPGTVLSLAYAAMVA